MRDFSLERFKALQRMHREHFWFAGRRALIAEALRDANSRRCGIAVDLGCGPGAHLDMWKCYARKVVGVDQFAEYVDSVALQSNIALVAADVLALPFDDQSVDLVFALDVIEHVPDEAALAEVMRVLKPDGVLIVTVPAFQWLWSVRDEEAGHRRRYTISEISDLIESAGLSVQTARYYQFFLFPIVVLSRLLGRSSRKMRDREEAPPRLMNKIFRSINLFEVRLGSFGLSMPIGSSVLVSARKPS